MKTISDSREVGYSHAVHHSEWINKKIELQEAIANKKSISINEDDISLEEQQSPKPSKIDFDVLDKEEKKPSIIEGKLEHCYKELQRANDILIEIATVLLEEINGRNK